ncbi:MAG: hypothetical protein R3A13_03865 [Bdellovibrionota bacterium]
MLKIGLICGGPSLERGISLNSARSCCDHLQSENIEIIPFYLDQKKNAYKISRAQLYSNTPSDFDFKLATTAQKLSNKDLIKELKKCDLAFPVIHGTFGEDGQIQKIFEKAQIPFIGSPSAACETAFDKFIANEEIRRNNFYAINSLLLEAGQKNQLSKLKDFFKTQKLKRAIVKPASGGSSIAVYSVSNPKEAYEAAHVIINDGVDNRVVVEPFCKGREFTVIILENRFGLPVAIMPTEIELNYEDHQIFDYRKKYLATRAVTYHCPPRFNDVIVERIQIQAEQLFSLFGMRDFGRFDGWILDNGETLFSDFNPVSGMEQNSFLFMQSARIGMTHRNVLTYVVRNACRRYGINFPEDKTYLTKKNPINVIFGGDSAERQVSLMSGTNVWLKLRNSKKYDPKPFLLDTHLNVWQLPYGFALNHTVEEILDMCEKAVRTAPRLTRLRTRILDKLNLLHGQASETDFLPKKMSLKQFIIQSKHVFIGLHGGIGENGELQKMLERAKVPFNGPGSIASNLCANKYETALALQGLESKGIYGARQLKANVTSLYAMAKPKVKIFWKEALETLNAKTLIIKPLDDGCSAGIVRLFNFEDLRNYIKFAKKGATFIPDKTLSDQHGIIEMPANAMKQVLLERFIETDNISVEGSKLNWNSVTNWVEVTVGVVQNGKGIKALNPSITVAEGNVLSLEEKFQGGTGINITPPPTKYVSEKAVQKAKEKIEIVANKLGIEGYSRIDAFMHRKTGDVVIIEANSLPGLTPSTVIYHQALAEPKMMYPVDFLEELADISLKRFK